MLERERRGGGRTPKPKQERGGSKGEASGPEQDRGRTKGKETSRPLQPNQSRTVPGCLPTSQLSLRGLNSFPRVQALHQPQTAMHVGYTAILPPSPGSGTCFRDWDQSGAPQSSWFQLG